MMAKARRAARREVEVAKIRQCLGSAVDSDIDDRTQVNKFNAH